MTNETTEESSILILADGRLLVRNVTPRLAAMLLALHPRNEDLAFRAGDTVHSPALEPADAPKP
ncbi:MAG: hypothetical protein ACKV19_23955 [Verrucomicrobiales bacterium]